MLSVGGIDLKKYIRLFWTFAQIGACTFGGGYAMLPLLQKEVVEKYHWATEDELMDYYAIGQCTPGIIAVNTATFVGYKTLGVLGGIFATLGVVFPSLVIIMIIASFLKNFASSTLVNQAFAGIRVCVCVLIFDAVLKLGKKSLINKTAYIIFGIVILFSLFTKIPTAVLVVASGIVGYVLFLIAQKNGGRKNDNFN